MCLRIFALFLLTLPSIVLVKCDFSEKYDACGCAEVEQRNHFDYHYRKFMNPSDGDSLRLECCAKTALECEDLSSCDYAIDDFTVTWGKTDGDLVDGTFTSDEACYGQVLEIENIDPKYAGNYHCNITTATRQNISRKFEINMDVPKDFVAPLNLVTSESPVYAAVGYGLTLRCSFYTSDFTKIPVYWRKFKGYHEAITSTFEGVTRKSKVTKLGQHIHDLVISDVTEEHFGTYTCNLICGGGIEMSRTIIVVNAEYSTDSIDKQLSLLINDLDEKLTKLMDYVLPAGYPDMSDPTAQNGEDNNHEGKQKESKHHYHTGKALKKIADDDDSHEDEDDD